MSLELYRYGKPGRPCPYDTDGDLTCGRRNCPLCGGPPRPPAPGEDARAFRDRVVEVTRPANVSMADWSKLMPPPGLSASALGEREYRVARYQQLWYEMWASVRTPPVWE